MKSILITDDDKVNRHLLRGVLKAAGFAVSTAPDGSAALRQLKKKPCDLLLLDIWMPKMNGLEVLAHLRNVPSAPRVIVMTSDGTHYLQAAGGGGGALRAAGDSVGGWETFIIERDGGGVIRHGESITLRANDTQWYVTAERGGGGSVAVNGLSRGPSETFTILFVSPHSAQTPPGQNLPFTRPGRPFPDGPGLFGSDY